MSVKKLISLHMEYMHRFKVEFQQLLEQQTFAEVFFRNSDLLFSTEYAPYHHTLQHCFNCSFEGMALGLSRIWDERPKDENLISLPNLVFNFEDNKFLGCRGLAIGGDDRKNFCSLYGDPMRMRLRVVRTEVLAHSVMAGKSRDRKQSDISGKHEFDLVNGDVVAYCHKTLELLFSLNDQLTNSSWRGKKSMAEMASESNDRHVAFLKHFVVEVQ
jgi:hypothetical protein